jgi:hypothetical protein
MVRGQAQIDLSLPVHAEGRATIGHTEMVAAVNKSANI